MSFLRTIGRLLRSRFALNCYAWAPFLLTVSENLRWQCPCFTTGELLPHVVAMHLLVMGGIYTNTALLMPRLLQRGRHRLYWPAVLLLAAGVSVSVGLYSEWLIHRFPGNEKYCYIGLSQNDKDSDISWFWYFVDCSFNIVTIMILFGAAYLARHYFRERRQRSLLQRQQTDYELRLLKSQLNPHFLFNVLNSIYSLSLQKSDAAPENILKLSGMLRYLLYDAGNGAVPLDKEADMLRDYLDMEALRMGDKCEITFELAGDPGGHRVAPALLLPFVENAIKHGPDSMTTGSFVHVRLEALAGQIRFHCSNNYKPRADHASRQGGIGLDNVKRRLALLYPDQHSLTLRDEGLVFVVELAVQEGDTGNRVDKGNKGDKVKKG